jgi:NAD-dependent dihydropyrimidine dehydrogenase PreA subunit
MADDMVPEISAAACTGCGDCIPACDAHALALVNGKVVLAHPERCEYDGTCELSCPTGAIRVPYAIVFGS